MEKHVLITETELESVKEQLTQISSKLETLEKTKSEDKKWLDNDEACAYLHVSKRTLQTYRDDGVLPFSQSGGKILYKTADLDAHLEKHYIKAYRK